MKAWTARDLGLEPPISADLLPSSLKSGVRSGLHLAVLAHRRWEIAAHTMFLADALEPLVPGSVIDTLRLAVLCTVTVFHGQPLRYGESDELNDLLRKAVEGGKLSAGPAPFNIRSGAASAAIRHEIPPERLDFLEGASIVESTQMAPSAWQLFLPSNGWPTDMNALLLYLLGPDPLDVLYRRILGIPGRAAGGS